ncbi:MAG: hypothetical protein AAGJ37_13935, partial [Pseudomonadota bacterium]
FKCVHGKHTKTVLRDPWECVSSFKLGDTSDISQSIIDIIYLLALRYILRDYTECDEGREAGSIDYGVFIKNAYVFIN